jgi:hypothetical protein
MILALSPLMLIVIVIVYLFDCHHGKVSLFTASGHTFKSTILFENQNTKTASNILYHSF